MLKKDGAKLALRRKAFRAADELARADQPP
jgi:hypothetical protein